MQRAQAAAQNMLLSNAAQAQGAWPQLYQTTGGASVMPYTANVLWQDTSSNATYCSARAALAK